jgi:predicted phage-related endonuclease
MLTEQQKIERAGLVTASQAFKIVGARGLGQSGSTYAYELIAEELGYIKPEIRSSAIEHGNMYEPIAIEEYEKHTGIKVNRPNFLKHKKYKKYAGCTPDGKPEFKDDIGLEAKCPENPGVHLQFKITNCKACILADTV